MITTQPLRRYTQSCRNSPMAEMQNSQTILVVDDAPENIDILAGILQNAYQVKIAINGEKAWKILDGGAKIDLVLLDINMPVMDGYTLCKMIKEDARLKEIPVIFITASHESDDEVKGFELGAADFITKPFSPIKVKARVKAHIALYAKKIELQDSLEKLKSTQDQLVESQKMASLGSLAAGVAHELNTPLGISVTATSTLMDRTEKVEEMLVRGELKKSDMVEYLKSASDAQKMIYRNLDKSAKLVESFKAFSLHNSEEIKKRFSLGDFMRRMQQRFQSMFKGSEHQLELRCANEVKIDSYPEILESILERLVDNAMQHGLRDRSQGTVTLHCEESGESVSISVEDNGLGIPHSELANVFQPFFTTKRIQGYSGLGLSTVYNLVHHRLGATIEVQSRENEGTIFILRIPKQP